MNSVVKDKGVESKSSRLSKCRIAVGVTGGIGSIEVVKIIRELRRHGADITPFLTPSVTLFISELSLSWAADREVIASAGENLDHLDPFDLVLVVPTTLNSLSKFVAGIADNAVTLLVASQLGRRAPLILVPAMNNQLAHHPLFEETQKKLESWGAIYYPSPDEEGRLKVPDAISLAEFVVKHVEEYRASN